MNTQSGGNTLPEKFEDIEALHHRPVHSRQADPWQTDQVSNRNGKH